MMTIKQKIQHADAFSVNLYREGIFWAAYEQSAFAVQRVKQRCKVYKRYENSVADLVVSLGITDDELPGVLSEFEVVHRDDSRVNLRIDTAIDLSDFKAWKIFLPATTATAFFDKYESDWREIARATAPPPTPSSRPIAKRSLIRKKRGSDVNVIKLPDNLNNNSAMPESAADLSTIADKLRAIDLSSINPIEALMFLSEIKREL
jgi:hypothetical protein